MMIELISPGLNCDDTCPLTEVAWAHLLIFRFASEHLTWQLGYQNPFLRGFREGQFREEARRGPGFALSGAEGGAQGDPSSSHGCARMQFGQSGHRNSDLNHHHSHPTHMVSWPLSIPAYSYRTPRLYNWMRHRRRQKFSHKGKNRVKGLREGTVC